MDDSNIYNKIKELYIEDQYKEIIEIKNANRDIDFLNPNQVDYIQLAEIIAVSYIELNLFKDALVVIDNCIDYLTENKNNGEDLTIFFSLRIEVLKKRNSLIKQYKTVLEYMKIGGDDSHVLSLINDIENALFDRYVVVNKIIMFIILIVIILSIFQLLYIGKPLLTMITTIGLLWYLFNYVFYKKIKSFYLRIIIFFV